MRDVRLAILTIKGLVSRGALFRRASSAATHRVSNGLRGPFLSL